METVVQEALDKAFLQARTFNGWKDQPVSDELLQAVYETAKWGPTSANCSPMRIVFVKSREAKERLKPCLAPTNADKTMQAPVTAIIAHDLGFARHMPMLFPAVPTMGDMFPEGSPIADTTAFRNGSLQGAYLMIAARMHGLDCGPMSGFDNAKVDQAFFADMPSVRSNFICNLGYGVPESRHPRGPRLAFEQACSIA